MLLRFYMRHLHSYSAILIFSRTERLWSLLLHKDTNGLPMYPVNRHHNSVCHGILLPLLLSTNKSGLSPVQRVTYACLELCGLFYNVASTRNVHRTMAASGRGIFEVLYRQFVPTFADRGCHVVSVTDPYADILGFLDRSLYFFFQNSSSIVLTMLSGPRSRTATFQKIW
jgi:hypothetical protein